MLAHLLVTFPLSGRRSIRQSIRSQNSVGAHRGRRMQTEGSCVNWRWSPTEGSRLRNVRIAELTTVNRSSPSISARFDCDPRHTPNSGPGLSRKNMIFAGRTRYAGQCHRNHYSNDFFVSCDHPDWIAIDRRPWCRLLGESATSKGARGTNHHPPAAVAVALPRQSPENPSQTADDRSDLCRSVSNYRNQSDKMTVDLSLRYI